MIDRIGFRCEDIQMVGTTGRQNQSGAGINSPARPKYGVFPEIVEAQMQISGGSESLVLMVGGFLVHPLYPIFIGDLNESVPARGNSVTQGQEILEIPLGPAMRIRSVVPLIKHRLVYSDTQPVPQRPLPLIQPYSICGAPDRERGVASQRSLWKCRLCIPQHQHQKE